MIFIDSFTIWLSVTRAEPAPEKVGYTEFDSRDWLRATVVLEAVQNKKKITSYNRLVPVCIQILSRLMLKHATYYNNCDQAFYVQRKT